MENNPPNQPPTINQHVSSIEPVIQSNTPPAPVSKSKKPFILIGILVAVLLLATGAGAYYFGMQNRPTSVDNGVAVITPTLSIPTPTPGPTATWKTYINNNYGFQFKYPEETFLFAETNLTPTTSDRIPVVNIQYCPSKNHEECAYPSNTFTVAVGLKQNVTSNDLINESTYSQINGQKKCIALDSRTDIEKINYNGYESVRFEGIVDNQTPREGCAEVAMDGGGKFKDLNILYKDYIIQVTIGSASQERYPLLDQILSTFKFTDRASYTANWKTYENSTIGFNVKYPPAWTVKETTEPTEDLETRRVTISGKEGSLNVLWTTGLGGGCEEQYQSSIKLADVQKTVCTGQSDPNTLSGWSWFESVYNGNGRAFSATITSTSKDNRNLMMDILSTLEVTRN